MGRRKRSGKRGLSRQEEGLSRISGFLRVPPQCFSDAGPRSAECLPQRARLCGPSSHSISDWRRPPEEAFLSPNCSRNPPFLDPRLSPRNLVSDRFEEAPFLHTSAETHQGQRRRVVLLPANSTQRQPVPPQPVISHPALSTPAASSLISKGCCQEPQAGFLRPPLQENGRLFEPRLPKGEVGLASSDEDYVVCDLSQYKKLQVPLRLRTAEEVAAGLGVRICGALGCTTFEKQRRLQTTLTNYRRELARLEEQETGVCIERRLHEKLDSTREAYARATREVKRLTELARSVAAEARSAAFAAEASEKKDGPLAEAAKRAVLEAGKVEAEASAARKEAEACAVAYREAETALLKERQVVDLTGSRKRRRKERQIGVLEQQLSLMRQLRTYRLQGKFEENGRMVQREVKCCVCASCAFKLNYEELLKKHQLEEWRQQFSALQEREIELKNRLDRLDEEPSLGGGARTSLRRKRRRNKKRVSVASQPENGSFVELRSSSGSVEFCGVRKPTRRDSACSVDLRSGEDGRSQRDSSDSAIILRDPSISRSVSRSPSCSVIQQDHPPPRRNRSISRSLAVSSDSD